MKGWVLDEMQRGETVFVPSLWPLEVAARRERVQCVAGR